MNDDQEDREMYEDTAAYAFEQLGKAAADVFHAVAQATGLDALARFFSENLAMYYVLLIVAGLTLLLAFISGNIPAP